MKRMKKLLVLLMVAVMALPMITVPAKAKAAGLTEKEIIAEVLGKIDEAQKSLKSCDETFSMELGVKMKGIGQLINVKMDGTGTEFFYEGHTVKAKASAVIDININDLLKPSLEAYIKAGKYTTESYVLADVSGSYDVYVKSDVPGEVSKGWIKTNVTQEQLAELLIQYGIDESTSPSISITDFANGLTVKEEGSTYVLSGNIKITKKMIKDFAKESGQLDGMSKKEKKEFNKTVKKFAKNLKPIKVNMVIDKETLVPVSQTVDFKAYANSVLKTALTMDKKDKEMVKLSKQLTITGCTVKSDLSNLNKAADFTIPADVAAAPLVPFEQLTGGVSGLN